MTTENTVQPVSQDYVMVNGLPLPSRTTRKNLTIATMLFCGAVIVWILLNGDDKNSLHVSAMAWSFMTFVATFFAYCFGAVVDNFNAMKK